MYILVIVRTVISSNKFKIHSKVLKVIVVEQLL